MFFLYDKSQLLYFSAMLHARAHDVDPGGVDGAVAQNVCQLGNILFQSIEGSGKELS